MDITIPKVIVKTDLGGYAPELKGKYLCMWVNPPMSVLRQHDEMVAASKDANEENENVFAWYALILSQGEDHETHWTAEELRNARAEDPAFYLWILREFWEARGAHVLRKKKN